MKTDKTHIDVLAFSPHPDDCELGCGGLLLKAKLMGFTTGIIDLTEGELSTRGNVHSRREETKRASEILKLDYRKNLRIPDGKIELNDKYLNRAVNVIRQLKPTLVVFPYKDERHPDHIYAHELLYKALFMSGLQKYKTEFPSHRVKKALYYYIHQFYWSKINPTFILDISDVFEEKMNALTSYKSQFWDPSSDDDETILSKEGYLEDLKAWFRAFGSTISKDYGEPYFAFENGELFLDKIL